MTKFILRCLLITLSNLSVSACNFSQTEPMKQEFANLPTHRAEEVIVEGTMSFWFYEGEAGCYGTLFKNTESIDVWINADDCGEVDYQEKEPAKLIITYNPDEQWGNVGNTIFDEPPSYTIVDFL